LSFFFEIDFSKKKSVVDSLYAMLSATIKNLESRRDQG
jgi:hypothetical protein